MGNREILDKLLKPKDLSNSSNVEKWKEFLNAVDENISLYPSAFEDFRDIIRLNNSNLIKDEPSVYIHTDNILARLIDERQINEEGYKVEVREIIELDFKVDFQESFDEHFKHDDYEKRISLAKNPKVELKRIKENFLRDNPDAEDL